MTDPSLRPSITSKRPSRQAGQSGWLCRLLALLVLVTVPCGGAEAKRNKKKTAAAGLLAPVFYPPTPQEPRYQFLGVITSTRQFEKKGGMSGFLFGKNRSAVELTRPYGVAFRDGKLYVCDTGGKTGFIFDVNAGEASTFNVNHPQLALRAPVNISLGAGGRKYVTDPRAGKLLVLGENDRPSRLFVSGRRFDAGAVGGLAERASDCELPSMNPSAAVEYEGELFVTDLTADIVRVLDPETGCQLRELGGDGAEEMSLLKPTNLAIGPQGYLYVSDTLNARVQKLDRQGRYIRHFGELGRRPGQFVRPKGVAVDPGGRLYVVDAALQVVQVFNADGQLLIALGQPGTDRGGLSMPAGIAIADDEMSLAYGRQLAAPGFELEYLVLVTNQMGPNRINLYGFGHQKEAGKK